jgi:hypothetical protein
MVRAMISRFAAGAGVVLLTAGAAAVPAQGEDALYTGQGPAPNTAPANGLVVPMNMCGPLFSGLGTT